MLMRDTVHQIDLGVIISFFKAILRKYLECVETHLKIPGRAARKLTHRLQMMLKKYTTSTGHTMSGKHTCLVPVTYAVSFVFSQLSDNKKTSRHLRATKFILDSLFYVPRWSEGLQQQTQTRRTRNHRPFCRAYCSCKHFSVMVQAFSSHHSCKDFWRCCQVATAVSLVKIM